MARTKTPNLYAPEGPDYTTAEVMEILRLKDPGTLLSWSKRGIGPPFFRNGRKHSKKSWPRRPFWAWYEARTFDTQADADEATQ